MTVNGTHCAVEEPKDRIWSQDREYYSHKYNRSGINYELGISIAENKHIWINGPFKAGKNDVSIFTKNGLKTNSWILKRKQLVMVGIMITIIAFPYPMLMTLRLCGHLNQELWRDMIFLTVAQKCLKFFHNDSEMLLKINFLLCLMNLFVSFASIKLNTRLHFLMYW